MLKRKIPSDLAFVIFLTLLCIPFVLIPPLNEISPIRIILGLPLVLFLPGYALIAALFIRKDDLDGIERIALSIAITPPIGFGIELHAVWNTINAYSNSSVGIYNCTCYRRVGKKKQNSRRG